ncbi:hypothetical protein [Methylobacterium sp. Leaf108]|uniref:hypothetical protein n=1 Tax=Methylobacterium sp. Leaf108 TaxID=1736256 RepID=UPI0007003338|nr:hypothetical protein [Methylobacterium sp. Leaf108]KQP59719.1 hypothetical protein ASF39_16370 [Methylobacterium sp. Leaf108]
MTDPSAAPLGTAGLVTLLTDRLLAGPSATAVLEEWCHERGLSAGGSRLCAVPVTAAARAPSAQQCERLGVGSPDLVRYRRVRLTCGAHVLSEAQNWYVPERLTPGMNRVLDTTATPFGRAVHALAPQRRNLSLERLWTQTAGRPSPATALFAIHAVLSTADGVPFCEVVETYRGAILADGG